ncbi:MAG: class D sortase [Vicinamibacterales bacterium]
MPASQRNSVASAALLWLERSLLAGAALSLLWCALFVADLVIAQRRARLLMPAVTAPTAEAREPALVLPALEDADAPAPPDAPMEIGAVVGTLSIPQIGLSAAVLHGSDATTLRRGPGHLEQTAYPGEAGNAVIAGHRDTFFWPLRHIEVGDDVFVDGPHGRAHYQVVSLTVVGPREVGVLAPTVEPTLTLITCYPFWVLGNAPDRFIVRATLVTAPAGEPGTSS